MLLAESGRISPWSTLRRLPMSRLSILDRVASGGVADHYDGAKDEEVVLQIFGGWPSATIPVDESGPRRCLKNSYGKARTQPCRHGGGITGGRQDESTTSLWVGAWAWYLGAAASRVGAGNLPRNSPRRRARAEHTREGGDHAQAVL